MLHNSTIHHRKTLRLKYYDYASEGYYFITICCRDRQPFFGRIENQMMCLSEAGQIAHKEWFSTLSKREFIELGEFIVMPNHIHGIVKIKSHLNSNKPFQLHQFSSPSHNLGAIIRGYKGAVSSQLGYSVWQRNYYEHIIRDEKSYYSIAEYIQNNPIMWEQDRFYIDL